MWKSNWAWLFLMVLLLQSCAVTTPVSPSLSIHPTATNIFLPNFESAPTQIPSPTKKVTKANTTTLTPSVMPQVTLTHLPTLSFYDSALKFQQLLLDNGGCRLPCFWGFTPGETTITELDQFMSQISPEIGTIEKRNGHYTIFYVHPESGDTNFDVSFFEEESVITAIEIHLDTARLSFPLTKLLVDYGLPDQVLIGNYGGFYEMFVLYSGQRIVGQYRLAKNGDYLCYDPKHVTGIVTWAEGKHWLTYVRQLFGVNTERISESSLEPLNQVTNYDLDSFYKQFSTKNRPICMTKNP